MCAVTVSSASTYGICWVVMVEGGDDRNKCCSDKNTHGVEVY